MDTIRELAAEQNIKYFLDIPDLSDFRSNPYYKGDFHIELAQEVHTRSGEIIFGTESHTCNMGEFGMFASFIGYTEASFIIGTGKLLVEVRPINAISTQSSNT